MAALGVAVGVFAAPPLGFVGDFGVNQRILDRIEGFGFVQHDHRRNSGDVDVRNKLLAAPLSEDALHQIRAHGANGGNFDLWKGFLKRASVEHQRRAPVVKRKLAFLLCRLNCAFPLCAWIGGFGGERGGEECRVTNKLN